MRKADLRKIHDRFEKDLQQTRERFVRLQALIKWEAGRRLIAEPKPDSDLTWLFEAGCLTAYARWVTFAQELFVGLLKGPGQGHPCSESVRQVDGRTLEGRPRAPCHPERRGSSSFVSSTQAIRGGAHRGASRRPVLLDDYHLHGAIPSQDVHPDVVLVP